MTRQKNESKEVCSKLISYSAISMANCNLYFWMIDDLKIFESNKILSLLLVETLNILSIF